MTTFRRCEGCDSTLNVWHIRLCHNCTKPVAAQPKTQLHLVKSDEADRDASTSQPASDRTHSAVTERRASDGF